MHTNRMQAGITAIAAAAFVVLGTAGAASAAPKTPAPPTSGGSCSVSVQAKTSGAFSNNEDVLGPGVVPGSVFVLATQGPSGTNNPAVTGFGPGTGYTVSADWSTVTLQTPYAGSNDGFTTYYSVFVNPCNVALTTGTSGAFSNNNDVIQASNIVNGSVFVVANVGQTPGQDNPSVNDYQFGLKGYTVTYTSGGATATLLAPFAGSNDGFTTYYTTATPVVPRCSYRALEQWNLNGRNHVRAVYQGSTYTYGVTFRQYGSCLSGTLTDPYYPTAGPIFGTVKGNHVTFSFTYPSGSIQGTRFFSGTINWRGQVSGYWWETGSESGTGTFALTRHAAPACFWWEWWYHFIGCPVYPW